MSVKKDFLGTGHFVATSTNALRTTPVIKTLHAEIQMALLFAAVLKALKEMVTSAWYFKKNKITPKGINLIILFRILTNALSDLTTVIRKVLIVKIVLDPLLVIAKMASKMKILKSALI